jgi:hypothetical protein
LNNDFKSHFLDVCLLAGIHEIENYRQDVTRLSEVDLFIWVDWNFRTWERVGMRLDVLALKAEE